ncbi:hypothetical protein EDD37DRAFT_53904 [Exophiala viscosa]|uniref:uncharacterized protein n=1 Tax=Exophiala viscosa TaxID=2486360 RepID=UPI00219D69BC|nr:hypothetical protein EDD37DRAFT_53904 [Exophiala viscosa]
MNDIHPAASTTVLSCTLSLPRPYIILRFSRLLADDCIVPQTSGASHLPHCTRHIPQPLDHIYPEIIVSGPEQVVEPATSAYQISVSTKALSTMGRSKSNSPSKSSSATVFLSVDDGLSTSVVEKSATVHTERSAGYVHRPRLPVIIWLIVSLPLIAWGSLYVFLRPHSMPGGRLHAPLWTPYALYGDVDYVYGWPAWNSHSGFTAAQSTMNMAESVLYSWYVYVIGSEVVDWSYKGINQLEVRGKGMNLAVLLGFSGAVMTVSKTLLYWLNEAFSGFDNIGHNSLYPLIVLWIIPNGAWIVASSYMIYVFGKDILESMSGERQQEEGCIIAAEKCRVE